MTCALEATYTYEYGFARKANYCVCIRLVCSKQVMRTSTALYVKWLILQRLSWLDDVVMTVVWMLYDLSEIAMTFNGYYMIISTLRWSSIVDIWLHDRLHWLPRRICSNYAILWSLFYNNLEFRLGRTCRLFLTFPTQSSLTYLAMECPSLILDLLLDDDQSLNPVE